MGKLPRVLMILRKLRCSASTALVVVDHLSDRRGEREKRDDILPHPPPGLADRRITLAPFALERFQPDERHVGVLGPIDCFDGGQDRLAILPGHEGQAVPDQVHDAGLHEGLRVNRGDRLREALETVDHRDENVVDAARLEFVDDLEPELGPLALLDPKPENLLLTVRSKGERDIDGLDLDQALVADLDAKERRKTPPDRPDRVAGSAIPEPRREPRR